MYNTPMSSTLRLAARAIAPRERHTAVVCGVELFDVLLLMGYFESVLVGEPDEAKLAAILQATNGRKGVCVIGASLNNRNTSNVTMLDWYGLMACDLLVINAPDASAAMEGARDTIYKHQPLIIAPIRAIHAPAHYMRWPRSWCADVNFEIFTHTIKDYAV